MANFGKTDLQTKSHGLLSFYQRLFNVKSNLNNCHFKTAIVELSEKVDEKCEAWWPGGGQKMRE